jgi:hypothetical protein
MIRRSRGNDDGETSIKNRDIFAQGEQYQFLMKEWTPVIPHDICGKYGKTVEKIPAFQAGLTATGGGAPDGVQL